MRTPYIDCPACGSRVAFLPHGEMGVYCTRCGGYAFCPCTTAGLPKYATDKTVVPIDDEYKKHLVPVWRREYGGEEGQETR